MVLSVARVPPLAIGRNTEHFTGAICSACAVLGYWVLAAVCSSRVRM